MMHHSYKNLKNTCLKTKFAVIFLSSEMAVQIFMNTQLFSILSLTNKAQTVLQQILSESFDEDFVNNSKSGKRTQCGPLI